jgi:hypothetical protein
MLFGTADMLAQRFEVTPFSGYRFGGGFKDVSSSTGDILVGDLDISNALNLGLVADVALGETIMLELLFDRQDTELTNRDEPVLDSKVNYYHIGLLFRGRSKVEPFFGVTTGATHFQAADDVEDELRGSMGLVLGGRTFFNDLVGLRFQSRFMVTYMGSNDQTFCDPLGCYSQLSDTIMRQIDLSAGVIFRF